MPSPNGNAGLHVRWEKAGLVLDALPIPWNADAVLVEANVRLPRGNTEKTDFALRLGEEASPLPAELIVRGEGRALSRILFRLPVPAQSARTRVHWREHPLGEIEIPVLERQAILDSLALELPSIHVTLGTSTVACGAFVGVQGKTLSASAIVRGAVPLVAAQDLELRVELERANGDLLATIPLTFTNEQRRARQALVTVALPKLRWRGEYRVSWHLGDRLLHRQAVRLIAKKAFQQSLRICATRFLVQRTDDSLATLRTIPEQDGALKLDGIRRVIPCFFVASGIAGLAGIAPFTVRAVIDDTLTTLAIEDDVLITDGPTPILLGSVAARDMPRVKHFTLASGDTSLGNLSPHAAPPVHFTAEGGFTGDDNYLWSAAAEEQLHERLGKLLDES